MMRFLMARSTKSFLNLFILTFWDVKHHLLYLIATLLGEISRTQLCSQKKADRRDSRMRRLKERVTTFKQKCRLHSKQSSGSGDDFISEEEQVIDYRTR